MNYELKTLPGSKSIINRLLMMALYHNIDLTLENFNPCDDVIEMLNIYDMIGRNYTLLTPHSSLQTPHSKLQTLHSAFHTPHSSLLTPHSTLYSINASGTCLRFILPYLAFNSKKDTTITLGDRLSKRPIQPLITSLNRAGAKITLSEKEIHLSPTSVVTDIFTIDPSKSSQFLTSLLLFASSRPSPTKIIIENAIASESYIQMTIDILKLFGTELQVSEKEVVVSPDPTFHIQNSKLRITLDPDYSTVCYLWMYDFLMHKPLTVPPRPAIYQPDYEFISILSSSNFYDLSNNPDQIITLSFIALFLETKTQISGCQTLKSKESDRITGIIKNIERLGGKASYKDDIITISPLPQPPQKCLLKTYNDHRFAMTFLVLQKIYPYLEIDDISCISKSFLYFKSLLTD